MWPLANKTRRDQIDLIYQYRSRNNRKIFFLPDVQFGFQLAAFRGKDPSLSNRLLSGKKYR